MNKKTKALNRKNNKLDDRVSPKNNTVMTDMVCYLRSANISEYDQEIVRNDLLEMILAAQERGEDVTAVIGTDEGAEKAFCDDVIAALPPRSTFQRILSGMDLLFLCIAILTAINIVLSADTFTLIAHAFTGKALNFNLSVTVGTLLSFGLIIIAALLIVEIIMKTALRKKQRQPMGKGARFAIGGLTGAAIMGVFLLIAWLGRETLFTVNIFAPILFALVAYIIHWLINRFN